MRRKTWFPVRLDESNPIVIRAGEYVRSDSGIVKTWEPDKQKGDFVRVFPCAARPWEILFLRMLDNQREKFAPAHGDGILVLRAKIEALPAI